MLDGVLESLLLVMLVVGLKTKVMLMMLQGLKTSHLRALRMDYLASSSHIRKYSLGLCGGLDVMGVRATAEASLC